MMRSAASSRLVTSCLLAATSSALSPFVTRFGGAARELASSAPTEPLRLASRDLAGVAAAVASARNVVVLLGAGASVSAGIPDFRTPGVGLYDNLEKYGKLPFPEAVFDLTFFAQNPAPFYALCKELWPGNYAPTPTHHFVALLAAKGKLRRCYTQNIDSLESAAGVPTELVVAAHGNMDSATCVATGAPVEVAEVRAALCGPGADVPPATAEGAPLAGWQALAKRHGGLVKPDIVFFGEALPDRFFRALDADFAACDLLLVAGTSLVVHPFASLPALCVGATPRALLNRERCGEGPEVGFEFDSDERQDVFVEGDCDAAVWSAAEVLGWTEELRGRVGK